MARYTHFTNPVAGYTVTLAQEPHLLQLLCVDPARALYDPKHFANALYTALRGVLQSPLAGTPHFSPAWSGRYQDVTLAFFTRRLLPDAEDHLLELGLGSAHPGWKDSHPWTHPAAKQRPLDPTEPILAQCMHFWAWQNHLMMQPIPAGVHRAVDTPRSQAAELTAFYSYVLKARGLPLAGMLSYLISWQMFYGAAVMDLFERLRTPDAKLNRIGNIDQKERVERATQAHRSQLDFLIRACVSCLTSSSPKAVKQVQQLGHGYLQSLKGMLLTFEDVLYLQGVSAVLPLPGQREVESPSELLPALSEDAGHFYREVQQVVLKMQAGTFLPHWLYRPHSGITPCGPHPRAA